MYTQNKEYNSANNKSNIADNLINNLLRDANNISELANFNDYADKVRTQIKYFPFCANITDISGTKFFLGKCTLWTALDISNNPNAKLFLDIPKK